MKKGYDNATQDKRGIFTRFLPISWKMPANDNTAHSGVISAIQNLLGITRQDIVQSRSESFLDTADDDFLDHWAEVVGLSRRLDETDDHLRNRIKAYITAQRGTIPAIIAGIKDYFDDPDLGVSIYEPYKNIFFTNKSLLNGTDKIKGNYYRYCVIDISISKSVDPDELQKVVDKYKTAGIEVFYTYVPGLSLNIKVVEGLGNLIPLHLPSFFTNDFGQDEWQYATDHLLEVDGLVSPIKKSIFTTNKSLLNSTNVLSGGDTQGRLSYNALFYGTDMNPTMSSDVSHLLSGNEELPSSAYVSTRNKDNLYANLPLRTQTDYLKEIYGYLQQSISGSFDTVTNDYNFTLRVSDSVPNKDYGIIFTCLNAINFSLDKNGNLNVTIGTPVSLHSAILDKLVLNLLNALSFSLVGNTLQVNNGSFGSASETAIAPLSVYQALDITRFYKDAVNQLDEQVNQPIQYIKVALSHTLAGANLGRVTILDKNGNDVSDSASWITYDTLGNVQSTPNGLNITDSSLRNSSWILKLSKPMSISSIAVATGQYDNTASMAVSVSSSLTHFITIYHGAIFNDTISLLSLSGALVKSQVRAFLASKLDNISLTLALQSANKEKTLVQCYNFSNGAWDSLMTFSSPTMSYQTINISNILDYLSDSGVFVTRILMGTKPNYVANFGYYGLRFQINGVGYQSLPLTISEWRTTF